MSGNSQGSAREFKEIFNTTGFDDEEEAEESVDLASQIPQGDDVEDEVSPDDFDPTDDEVDIGVISIGDEAEDDDDHTDGGGEVISFEEEEGDDAEESDIPAIDDPVPADVRGGTAMYSDINSETRDPTMRGDNALDAEDEEALGSLSPETLDESGSVDEDLQPGERVGGIGFGDEDEFSTEESEFDDGEEMSGDEDKTLIQKYMVPAVAAVMVGVVAFGGYSFYQKTMGTTSHTPPANVAGQFAPKPAPKATQSQVAGVSPSKSGSSNADKANAMMDAEDAAVGKAPAPTAQEEVAGQVPNDGLTTGALSGRNQMVLGSSVDAGDGATQDPRQMQSIDGKVDQVLERIGSLEKNVANLDMRYITRDDFQNQMEIVNDSFSKVDTRLTSLEKKMNGISQNMDEQVKATISRIDRFNKARSSGRSQVASATAHDVGVSYPTDVHVPNEPVRGTGLALPLKPRVVEGYTLRGIGRNAVWLDSSQRGLIRVAVGQDLPGAGRVRSVAKNNNSWVVVADRGVIVPASN